MSRITHKSRCPGLLMVLLFYVLSVSTHSQDSVSFHIDGFVSDLITGNSIDSANLSISINGNHVCGGYTDETGYYNLILSIQADDSKIILHCTKEDYTGNSRKIEFDNSISNKNGTPFQTKIDFKLDPIRICSDCFYPDIISFAFNDSVPIKEHLTLLKDWLSSQTIKELFRNQIFLISAYCAYEENESIALARATFIQNLFLSNGYSPDRLKIDIGKFDDFFLCQYCCGCYYPWQAGKGITLSKEEFIKAENQTSLYSSYRRTVLIEPLVK